MTPEIAISTLDVLNAESEAAHRIAIAALELRNKHLREIVRAGLITVTEAARRSKMARSTAYQIAWPERYTSRQKAS